MPRDWDLRLPSYGKINLGLAVLGKRSDGYHEIETIFQEIEFHDTLYFRKHNSDLAITTDHPRLPVRERNLVWKAVELLRQRAECSGRIAIHIEKHLPIGAGLGGGSSNAAIALIGMNRLFDLRLTRDDLGALGAQLGSDVSFFLYGGTAVATGRGEHIRQLSDFPPAWVVLVNPGIHISSGWAYKNVNLKLTNSEEINNLLPRLHDVEITDTRRVPLENMLEAPVIHQYPIIGSIKSQLLECGAEWAMMSGSGSAVFGVFKSKGFAEKALHRMEQPGWVTIVTRLKQRKSIF